MKVLILLICLLPAASLTACEQGVIKQGFEAQASKQTGSSPISQKPGAPIHISSSYDGETSINQLENFELEVTAGVAGELTVAIANQDNILSAGDILMVSQVLAGQLVTIPVAVTLLAEGKYYLNIDASINVNSKVQSKSFAIAIYSTEAKSRAEKNSVKPHVGDGAVIIMPAEETIKFK